ncbi:MAG: TRAP transporter substrate-binding protein [Pusillimonas sp.]|nr:TRAP transporter substrate-binding protein [Pusillimonas sp.]
MSGALLKRLSLVLFALLLATCSRQPDKTELYSDLQTELTQTYGDALFKIVDLQRRGTAQDSTEPQSQTRRVVYYDVTLQVERDVELGGWDQPGVASLVTLLGAGSRGVVGVKSGGNEAGDLIEAHGSAIYRKEGSNWTFVTPPGLTSAVAPSYETGVSQPVSRQLLGTLNEITQSVVNRGSTAAQQVLQQELQRSVARIDGRLARMQQGYPLAGGPEQGEYAAFAQALGQIGREQGVRVAALTTGGSVENIGLLRSGDAVLAIAQADTARLAYEAQGPFESQGQFAQIRALGSLYPEMVHIVVRDDAGLNQIADLKGKTLAMGPSGSAIRTTLTAVLAAHGLQAGVDYEASDLPFAASLPVLNRGGIDATVHIIGVPARLLRDALAEASLKLLPLERDAIQQVVTSNPVLIPLNIAAGTYPGQRESIPTVGMAALLLSTDVITRDEARRITEVLYESGNDLLEQGSAQGAQVSIQNARRGLSVPLHAGSQEALLDLENVQRLRAAEKQAP